MLHMYVKPIRNLQLLLGNRGFHVLTYFNCVSLLFIFCQFCVFLVLILFLLFLQPSAWPPGFNHQMLFNYVAHVIQKIRKLQVCLFSKRHKTIRHCMGEAHQSFKTSDQLCCFCICEFVIRFMC